MLVSDLYCPSCRNAKDHKPQDNEVCWSCVAMGGAGNYKESKTEADRIRAMSDEGLAETFANYVSCHDCPIPYCKVRFTMERLGCQANWLDYLKQEADNG